MGVPFLTASPTRYQPAGAPSAPDGSVAATETSSWDAARVSWASRSAWTGASG